MENNEIKSWEEYLDNSIPGHLRTVRKDNIYKKNLESLNNELNQSEKKA